MNEQELYEHAVTLLAKRDYSSGEIYRHLKRNSPDEETIIETVMERLISHHYLDDSFTSNRTSLRRFGCRLVRACRRAKNKKVW